MFRGRLRAAFERLSLAHLLIGLGVLLVAINIGSAVWDAHMDRERIFHDVQRDLSNIARLLTEQTASGLEAVDLVLRDIQRLGPPARVAAQVPRLQDEVMHLSQVAAILVFDADGRVVARTNQTPTLDAVRRERAYVDVHRAADVGLYVSDPYLGGQGSHWRFVLSRRLNAPGGEFAGAVAALVEVEAYERLYSSIDLGEGGGGIGLFNASGSVITRVPDPMQSKGTHLAATLPLAEKVRRDGRFDGRVMSDVMKEPVIVSIGAVRGFPLFVSVSKSEHA